MEIFFPGQQVLYVGRGFPGFDEKEPEVEVQKVKRMEVIVKYKFKKISVFHHELKTPNYNEA